MSTNCQDLRYKDKLDMLLITEEYEYTGSKKQHTASIRYATNKILLVLENGWNFNQ